VHMTFRGWHCGCPMREPFGGSRPPSPRDPATRTPERTRRHRLRAAILILAGSIAAWGVLGAIFLPGYFRSRLERIVSEHTSGSLSIGRLGVNPFIMAAGIHDFGLLGPALDTRIAPHALTLTG